MEQFERNLDSSDGASFGISELDGEDQRLRALVHELNQAITDGRGAEEIQRVMNKILRDAISHFEHEEQVLSSCAYPLPEGHAGLHRQMRAELEHAMERFCDVKARATWADYGLLVEQLFVEHVRQEVMKYKNFQRTGSISDLPRT
jgi:hemerythrin